MLVLTRDLENNDVIIDAPNGDQIIIKLLETERGKAKLGFTAPKEYHILRGELKGFSRDKSSNG